MAKAIDVEPAGPLRRLISSGQCISTVSSSAWPATVEAVSKVREDAIRLHDEAKKQAYALKGKGTRALIKDLAERTQPARVALQRGDATKGTANLKGTILRQQTYCLQFSGKGQVRLRY